MVLNLKLNIAISILRFMSKPNVTQKIILAYLASKLGNKARFLEMNEKLKISKATLSRNLKDLVNSGILERKVESESKEYPPPVYYSITEKGLEMLKEILQKSELEVEYNDQKNEIVIETSEDLYAIIKAISASQDQLPEDFLRTLLHTAVKYLNYTGKKELSEKEMLLINLFYKHGFGELIRDSLKIEEMRKSLENLQKMTQDSEILEELTKTKEEIEKMRQKLEELIRSTFEKIKKFADEEI